MWALKSNKMTEVAKPLNDFFSAIESDGRISITHIGIFAALLQYRIRNDYGNQMELFSRDIMRIAKISSITTFQKCIKELDEFGYLRYERSFKRNRGSRVYFH